jgi:protein-tyrosine phosphatase
MTHGRPRRFAFGMALAVMAMTAPAFARPLPAGAVAQGPESRFIPMEGGRNFRDLGGYRTADGRTVRWGRIYRSGSLGALTPAAAARLEALHPSAIIDLRSTEERASDTNRRLVSARIGYWARPYSLSQGDFAQVMKSGLTAERSRQIMLSAYRALPREQAPSYRVLFSRLMTAKGPVVFNCSAGKDRTGLGAALVLRALGVRYAVAREDYLLSRDAPGMATMTLGTGPITPALAPIMAVEPGYLDAAFDQIDRDYGSLDAYLARALGVGPHEKQRLRARLLH